MTPARFICPDCAKSFRIPQALAQHRRDKHGTVAEALKVAAVEAVKVIAGVALFGFFLSGIIAIVGLIYLGFNA